MYVPVNPIEALLAKRQLQEAIPSVLSCLAFRGFGHGKGFLIFQASYCFSRSFDTNLLTGSEPWSTHPEEYHYPKLWPPLDTQSETLL